MATTRTGPYGQIILFGDSITEQSACQDRGFAFMPALQNAYMRRLDVINRGFSGYNTTDALKVLPDFMPSQEQGSVRILVIFFGANDSCLPGSITGQHVPLSEFRGNLKAFMSHEVVKAHEPTIILITTSPCDEYAMEDAGYQGGSSELVRTAEHTKKYADACKEVAEDMGVAVVDLWSAIMAKASWQPGEILPGSKKAPRSPVLKDLLLDGLHFSPEAYKLLFEEVLKTIQSTFPEQTPESLHYTFPHWATLHHPL